MLSVTQTGLNAVQKELNVLSNNLANASTVGFKRSYTNFGDIFSNDPASNPKTSIGMGIATQSVSRDTTQGALKSTSNVTDLAIDGQGYFVLGTNLPTEPLTAKVPSVIPSFNGNGLTLSRNIQPQPPVSPILIDVVVPPTDNLNNDLQVNSVVLRLFNVNAAGNYEGPDDGYKVYVDDQLVTQYTAGDPNSSNYHRIAPPPTIDLTSFVKTTGSSIKVEFFNADTLWDWGYSLSVNGQNIFAETSPPNTVNISDGGNYSPEKLKFTTPSFLSSPNFSTYFEKKFLNLPAEFPGAGKLYVRTTLQPVGLGTNSTNGFSGRDQYINFGDNDPAYFSSPDSVRAVDFRNQDLTNSSKINFDCIRGNGLNGGSEPINGEEFGIYYSIDNGNSFKELKSGMPWGSNPVPAVATIAANDSSYDNWKTTSIDIPDEAKTDHTIIRFSTRVKNRSDFKWGLTNISYTAAEPPSINIRSNNAQIWNKNGQWGSFTNVFRKSEGSGLTSSDGFIGRPNYISFNSAQMSGERYFTIQNLDLTKTDTLSFDLIKGNDLNGGESPDAGEGFSVEYSTDGTNFKNIEYYSVSDQSLNIWSNKSIQLPADAKTSSTTLRFRQGLSSGKGYDSWGLSNIALGENSSTEPVSTSIATSQQSTWAFNNLSGNSRNVFLTNAGPGINTNDQFAGKSSYIIFGTDGSAGERYLTYNPLDLSMKQNISFDIIRGNGTNGGDSPNISAENLSLLYSTDNGVTFKTLKTYSFNDPSITNWMTDSIALPKEAQTESTILKFYQPQSSGAPYDHWGLSNIAFTDTPPKPEVVPQLVYSRAGNFGVDKDGYVVNPSGFKLMGTDIKTGKANKAVRIPSADPVSNQPLQAVSINNKGVVSATYGAGPSVDLYRISIATFASDAGLKPLGNVAFAQTGASGTAKISNAGEGGGGNVMAGTLEQANVDITNELMAMIAAQQIYNGNARMLQSQIEALKRLTDNI